MTHRFRVGDRTVNAEELAKARQNRAFARGFRRSPWEQLTSIEQHRATLDATNYLIALAEVAPDQVRREA